MTSQNHAITPAPTPARLAARGFTMIEILTVIAIIALLATITVVGLKHVGGNANEKQTRTVLEIMRSSVARAIPLDDPKSGDKFYGNVLVAKYNLTLPANRIPGGLAATTLASDTITNDVIRYLSSNANARKEIESLPPQLRKSVGGVTVPLDAWGNEIKFIYGNVRFAAGDSLVTDPSLGGLGAMYSKSAEQYWPGTGGYTPPNNLGITFQVRPNNEKALQAPDKSCFWVSAGADGKFETHDDNLYSFEGN